MQEVHHRGSDDVINEVKALIEAEAFRNKEWQDKHDREALDFRTQILAEIRPFQEFRLSLSWFWRIALAVSGLVWSVLKGTAWLKDHLK
jgi:hypothetical protein